MTPNRGGIVLVVDDYEDAREIFSTFLQFAGYEVLTATDGLDALDVAKGTAVGGLIPTTAP